MSLALTPGPGAERLGACQIFNKRSQKVTAARRGKAGISKKEDALCEGERREVAGEAEKSWSASHPHRASSAREPATLLQNPEYHTSGSQMPDRLPALHFQPYSPLFPSQWHRRALLQAGRGDKGTGLSSSGSDSVINQQSDNEWVVSALCVWSS